MILHNLCIILCYVSFIQCAKILFISTTPSPSHQKPFQLIWKTLALRGHEVHAVTPNPLINSTIPTLVQYDVSDVYDWVEVKNKQHKDTIQYLLLRPSFVQTFEKELIGSNAWHTLHQFTFSHPQVQRLIHEQKHFDAVIVEWLTPTFAVFGTYFNAPLIGICSLGAPTNSLDAIGNILNPIVTPDHNIPMKREDLSFRNRLLSSLYAIWIRLVYHWYILPMENNLIKKYISNDLPYLGDMAKNISLLLLNRNQISHRVMSVVPGIIEYGGIKYDKTIQTLRPDLKSFLDNSSNGVVYMSFGAAIKIKRFLKPEQVEIFKNTFKQLPYNVLWKSDYNIDNKPDNVFICDWLNQTAVLEHPNVKLFITQGGLQSTEETIAAHMPIIGMPFHSDQTSNVDTCVQHGMGKSMDLEDVTVEKLTAYIMEIMNDPSYAKNAKKLDELMNDQPQDSLEKAIWWIEYVIRHKGAKHLRSPAADLPWWKFFMLDVFGLIIGVIFLVLVVAIYVIKRILSFICKEKKVKKTKKKKIQ